MASHAREGEHESWGRALARGVEALPEAFLAVVALAAGVGVLSAWLGLRPLANSGQSRVLLCVLVVVGAVALVRGARAGRRPDAAFLSAVPALVLLGYALAARLLSPGARAEWFLGGDHVRHLIYVADEHVAGNLDYAAESYPRAWHTVVTTIWSAGGANIDGQGLRSLVELMSTCAWFLPALLSLATGSLTSALSRRCGTSSAGSSVAGLVGAAAVLLPPFLANYQALGFENSYVGAIVLAVVAREVVVLDDQRRSRSLAVALIGVVVCAHSWQLLLPATGVALLFVAWTVARQGSPRQRLALLAGSVLCGVAALPAMLALFTVIGIQHATDSGVEAPVPLVILGLGVASAFAVVVRRPGDRELRTLLAIVLLPGLTAVGVAAWVGIPLSDYYPSKLLWHSAMLGLSPLAVVVVLAWDVLRRQRPSATVRVARSAGLTVAVLFVAYALLSPAAAFVGAWSSTRGPIVLGAITSPGARDAQVVWLGDVGDDTIGRVLLDFYRVPEPGRTPQPPLDVAEECALLRAAEHPAVLSNRSAQDVITRYTCVVGVELVRANG